jgi:hypothetical protein
MKIRLTESQYKKLFEDDSELLSIGNIITPKIIKIMRYLKKVYTNTNETTEDLKKNWGLSDPDATTIINSYEKSFKNTPESEYESFLGESLEFQGTYIINVNLPAVVEARTFFDYQITVRAGSREEALLNATTLINDPSFDGVDLIDSPHNASVELDWDFIDAELVKDMSVDTLRRYYTDFTPKQLEQYIDLKE